MSSKSENNEGAADPSNMNGLETPPVNLLSIGWFYFITAGSVLLSKLEKQHKGKLTASSARKHRRRRPKQPSMFSSSHPASPQPPLPPVLHVWKHPLFLPQIKWSLLVPNLRSLSRAWTNWFYSLAMTRIQQTRVFPLTRLQKKNSAKL